MGDDKFVFFIILDGVVPGGSPARPEQHPHAPAQVTQVQFNIYIYSNDESLPTAVTMK